jgi:hypothetical protein
MDNMMLVGSDTLPGTQESNTRQVCDVTTKWQSSCLGTLDKLPCMQFETGL